MINERVMKEYGVTVGTQLNVILRDTDRVYIQADIHTNIHRHTYTHKQTAI